MSKKVWLLYHAVLLLLMRPPCSTFAQKFHPLVDSKSRDSLGVRQVGDVQQIDADFDKQYVETVEKDREVQFTYTFTEVINKTTAIRAHVSAPDSSKEFPTLFVVKQQRHILSWQVPLYLENVYDYYNVSRTLCPLAINDMHVPSQVQQINIDVSTSSETPITFNLEAHIIQHFELQTNREFYVEVSPSEPKYYHYVFPPDVRSVVIKVESDDNICMIFSIQDTQCPVFDLVRNVEFQGTFQTVTKKGAITVAKNGDGVNGTLFVVLVVKPSNFECSGNAEDVVQPPDGHGNDGFHKVKKMKIFVTPSISGDQYLGAVLGAVAWFLSFYVISLIISCIFSCRQQKIIEYQENLPDAVLEETASLLASTPQDSILSETLQSDYGTTTTAHNSGTDFSRRSNGIPHRIPPPTDNSDTGEDEDFDMLHDAEQEKDVVRTKTILYVSDLSRKDKKNLAKKYRLFHWNILTIAIFYGLPVVQLVITYQTVLHVTGNEDICYYNFYCAHPLGLLSAFNNVFSNIGYIMLGFLFLILVLRRDIVYHRLISRDERLQKHYGIPQHFGLFYAMGIALIMEGILSGCYHVCPSYSNFQFDTAFMYMMGWLCMLKIYQTRHPDICPQAYVAYFAMAFVIALAVVGVVYGTLTFWILFAIVQVTLTLLLSVQIYYMGTWKFDLGIFQRIYLCIRSDFLRCARPMYTDRMILLVIGNLVNWSLALYGVIVRPKDFASLLLAIFIINLLMYFAFYIIMKLRCNEKIRPIPLFYIVLAAIVWGFSFYFFLAKLTSWEYTPAVSREGNKGCLLFGFYDDHDIWHGLSAMALFLSFMVLLTMDDDLLHTPRDKIPVF